jgi:hypothetical protein
MFSDVVKLAPLFVQSRAARKSKVDAATVEARQNFLKSGFPDSLKKLVDMQRRYVIQKIGRNVNNKILYKYLCFPL